MASCKLWKLYYSIQQRRSWKVSSPKFNIKLLTVVVFLAYLVILKPASTLFLPRCPSEQASDPTSFLHSLGNNLHFSFKWRSHGGGRRILLQDGRFRPTPTGYPPPEIMSKSSLIPLLSHDI